MDEKSARTMGEAIGLAIAQSNEKMSEKFVDMMTQAKSAFETGVVTEVDHRELADRMHRRADELRARAEEIATERPELATARSLFGALPPHVRYAADVVNSEAVEADKEALLREHNEKVVRNHQDRVKATTTALRTEAERLDFMANHLEPRKYRLEARELDLIFGDRHCGVGYSLPGGPYSGAI